MKVLVICFALILLPAFCFGAATSEVGNKPLSAANYKDWPNLIDAINDTSRVFQLWVNGNESFYYQGDTEVANRVLKEFAETEFPELHVVLVPGPGTSMNFGTADVSYNFRINVVGGIARAVTQRGGLKEVYSLQPTMTIYLTKEIELKSLRLPEGVTLLQLHDLQSRFEKGLESDDKETQKAAQYMLDQLNAEFQRQGAEFQALEKQIAEIEGVVKTYRKLQNNVVEENQKTKTTTTK